MVNFGNSTFKDICIIGLHFSGVHQGANVGLEDSSELAAALGPILRSGGGGDASQIQTALKEFWSSRLDRVSKIHAASREYRNGTGLDPAFRQWTYSWQPSFDWKSR